MITMSISIRAAAEVEDAGGLAEVHVASWRSAYRDMLPRSYLSNLRPSDMASNWRRRLRDTLKMPPRKRDVWVAEMEGEIVGFSVLGACLDDDELAGFAGEFFMLYVHPKYAGRGVGRELVSHGMEVLGERDFYWCVIWVLERNQHARGFYERMGFAADGAERYEHFAGVRVPVVRYAAPVGPVMDFDEFLRRSRTRVP